MSEHLSDTEILQLRTLLEVEKIRQLRIDYSLAMDERNFERLIACFTDDAVCEYGPYGSWSGEKAILENYRASLSGELAPPFSSQHINTNHNIELLSSNHAKGQCYLIDVVTHVSLDQNPILWFALYDEEYRKDNEQWKFSRSSLQFFWPQRHLTAPYGE